ncbi:hypothetical protein BN1180_02227 [Peribacillus simplex]|uniref:Uncharacterized protein n=1 Tax=Peribacillus simplex TaxID=1478 RepID=A0AAN2PGB1_9BACI|nr:hypothetical protein BN1180_02227 [Peribacillus simplex]
MIKVIEKLTGIPAIMADKNEEPERSSLLFHDSETLQITH